jgi:hypothetical protein
MLRPNICHMVWRLASNMAVVLGVEGVNPAPQTQFELYNLSSQLLWEKPSGAIAHPESRLCPLDLGIVEIMTLRGL